MGTDQIDNEALSDQQLAAFTDAHLAGTEEPRSIQGDQAPVRPELADAVETLARTLGPQPPSDSLQRQIRRSIAAEWPQPRPSLNHRLRALFRWSARRWAWGASAALILLAVAVAILVRTEAETIPGTIPAGSGTALVVIFLVLAAVLGLAWLAGRRGK
jgi:hypothetical protein